MRCACRGLLMCGVDGSEVCLLRIIDVWGGWE